MSQEALLLQAEVEAALLATRHRSLREIRVSVQGQLIVLSGHVSSYYLKQLALIAARSVAGGYEIRNDVIVSSPTLQKADIAHTELTLEEAFRVRAHQLWERAGRPENPGEDDRF